MKTAIRSTLIPVLGRIHDTVRSWLNAPRFFWVIVGLLVLQSVWIALTARYPQAFDENYHFGLIQLHAQQWLPFFTYQPAGADIYGAVVRDPSYLYHYVLSIPYRLLGSLTDSLALQVIILRLINLAFFVWGLFASRTLLKEIGASRRMTHTVLFFFVITPIMPLLAAQINYDNVIFPLNILIFLTLVRFYKQLQQSGTVSVNLLLQMLAYGMVASLIKYTFTPIFLGVVVAAGVLIARKLHRESGSWKRFFVYRKNAASVALVILLVLLGGLFAERYLLNMLTYQTPVPDCGKVLTIEQCKQYSPWARDHLFAEIYPRPTAWGIFVYPVVWAHRMVWETMFTVSSRFYPDSIKVEYVAASPLTVANYTAWTIVVIGLVLCLLYARRLWRMKALRLLLIIIGFYTAVLFTKNFAMYLHTGEAVAIHGRYLIPVFPVLYYMMALGFYWALNRIGRPKLHVWLVIITTLLMIHGGGIIVWLVRSDHQWYWQQSSVAQQANHSVKRVLQYTIIKELP